MKIIVICMVIAKCLAEPPNRYMPSQQGLERRGSYGPPEIPPMEPTRPSNLVGHVPEHGLSQYDPRDDVPLGPLRPSSDAIGHGPSSYETNSFNQNGGRIPSSEYTPPELPPSHYDSPEHQFHSKYVPQSRRTHLGESSQFSPEHSFLSVPSSRYEQPSHNNHLEESSSQPRPSQTSHLREPDYGPQEIRTHFERSSSKYGPLERQERPSQYEQAVEYGPSPLSEYRPSSGQNDPQSYFEQSSPQFEQRPPSLLETRDKHYVPRHNCIASEFFVNGHQGFSRDQNTYMPPSPISGNPVAPKNFVKPPRKFGTPLNSVGAAPKRQFFPPGGDLSYGGTKYSGDRERNGQRRDPVLYAAVDTGYNIPYPKRNFKILGQKSQKSESKDANYQYDYMVRDEPSGNEYQYKDRRRPGDGAQGVYYIVMPDGKKQTVEYQADENSVNSRVHYEKPIARNNNNNIDRPRVNYEETAARNNNNNVDHPTRVNFEEPVTRDINNIGRYLYNGYTTPAHKNKPHMYVGYKPGGYTQVESDEEKDASW